MKRVWMRVVVSLAVLLVVVGITALFVARTQWFSDFLRAKIISELEDSTGGKVEIQSFRFELSHLTVLAKGLVIHGTEPPGVAPLAAADSVELHLKLFSSFEKAVDLAYLGIEKPRINFIVNPDGSTNLPTPKVKSPPSGTSPLATVVDLAVGQFRVDQGSLSFLQKQTPISLVGNNLRIVLDYNGQRRDYEGRIQIAPVNVASAQNKPHALTVDLPLVLERDAVRISNGRVTSDQSELAMDASLENLKSPIIAANLRAKISTNELQPDLKGAPTFITANLDGSYEDSAGIIALRGLNVVFGKSSIHAAGTADPAKGQKIEFDSNLSLGELSSLFKMVDTKVSGDLLLNGKAGLDSQRNYLVNGTVSSKELNLAQGDVKLSNISVVTPFRATPELISLDDLRLAALGGTLSGKVSLSQMRMLAAEGNLQGFSLRTLAQAFSGKPIGYAGAIGGTIKATSDLKATAGTGVMAAARLAISPRGQGVPVNGSIQADYNGRSGLLDLHNSYVAWPQSRATLAGAFNQKLDLRLTSKNLNDFLPVARWSSGQANSVLPITLKGGIADLNAQIDGSLSAPKIKAQAVITKFIAKDSLFDKLSFDAAASPSSVTLQNGQLLQKDLRSSFDASLGLVKWQPVSRSPVSANVHLQNAGLGDLLALAGQPNVTAAGAVSADVHIAGTYGDPLGNADLQIPNGQLDNQPFNNAEAGVNLSHGMVSLNRLQISSAGGTLHANGTFRHPSDSIASGHLEVHVQSQGVQLAMVQPLQQKSPGVAGAITLKADAAGDLVPFNKGTQLKVLSIETNLSATNLRVHNQDAGNLTAIAHTNSGVVSYSVKSNFSGSNIDVDGKTALNAGYSTQATATIRSLSLKNALDIAGQSDLPIAGIVSADASLNGPIETPTVRGSLDLAKGNIYQEPVNHLSAKLAHNATLTEISAFDLDLPAGHLSLTGRYDHPNDLDNGTMQVRIDGGDLQIGKLQHVQLEEPGMSGVVRLTADAVAHVTESRGKSEILLTRANADVRASGLAANNHNLGKLTFTARTQNANLNFQLDSDLAQSKIHAAGQSQLVAGYPTKANLEFANVHYVNLAPFLGVEETIVPSFDALVEGKASVDGPLKNSNSLRAQLELARLEIHSATRASVADASARPVAQLKNDGPVIVSLNQSLVKVEQFHIRGPKTAINISGGVDFATIQSPLQLKVDANTDLGILQDVDQKFYSSGAITAVAVVGGTFGQPLVNGKIELKKASINYADIPNGLSNGNGVILLNGTTASLRNVTGESGGGKVAVTGFVGLSPRAIVYNLKASAKNVRTRSNSVSITSNANLELTGSSRRSLLAGKVTVERIAYSSSSDIGSILYGASSPPAVASTPSPLLANMRLDINVVTASDVRIVTSYVEKLDLTSNLNVRGTAAEPGVVGHVTVTDGQLAFFGNTYTVNRGSINFYDPTAIKPELDLSLETIAQGVDVIVGVTGPMSDMKLSYRSDPPLTFQQIAALLATNTTPFDPTIAANQPPAPQQSMSQMGESAVLSQAIASPVASRVQRVFGLTQFKIDPSVAGSNGQPTAKVTLQQKIANNITFTYITDVTQSNSEIVRVQWDLGPRTSAVALRDYNGNVSVELFYKLQKR